MSETSLTQHLVDIKAQCQLIIDAVATVSFDDYLSDIILKSAVERFIINIGISASQIRNSYPDAFETFDDLHLAIGIRNRLAHGYGEAINDSMIWDVTQRSVPRLLWEIERHL